MRPPLDHIFIRSARDDAKYRRRPGIRSDRLLKPDASPAGGAFGYVRSGGTQPHQGWDIYAPVNAPIRAISDGTIVEAARGSKLGRYVVLRFTHGARQLYAVYAHLCQVSVAVGQVVTEGQVLGGTGTDGNAWGTPPHLHFEIRTTPNYSGGLNNRVSPGSILGGHYGLH